MLETGLKALQMQRYEKLFRKPPLIGTDKYIKKIKAGQTGLSYCIRESWSSALPVMASGHGGFPHLYMGRHHRCLSQKREGRRTARGGGRRGVAAVKA